MFLATKKEMNERVYLKNSTRSFLASFKNMVSKLNFGKRRCIVIIEKYTII
jgi:hypothetical protein